MMMPASARPPSDSHPRLASRPSIIPGCLMPFTPIPLSITLQALL